MVTSIKHQVNITFTVLTFLRLKESKSFLACFQPPGFMKNRLLRVPEVV